MPYLRDTEHVRPTQQYADLRGGVPKYLRFGNDQARDEHEARVRALRASLKRGEFAVSIGCVIERTRRKKPLQGGERVTPAMLLDEHDASGALVATGQQRFWAFVRDHEIIEGL
jgi:hypothetical protein